MLQSADQRLVLMSNGQGLGTRRSFAGQAHALEQNPVFNRQTGEKTTGTCSSRRALMKRLNAAASCGEPLVIHVITPAYKPLKRYSGMELLAGR